jgi:hypothetical protein
MVRSSSRTWVNVTASALACAAAFSWGSRASAQTTEVTTTAPAPPPPPSTVVVQPAAPVATTTTTSAPVVGRTETKEEGYVPNPYLLTTGLVLWGVPYTTSVVVAAQSSNSADQHLYVPIVGPWIDLGQRGGCPIANNSCNTETTNKVLLGVDGVFQAIGTLEVIWGFLRPEHREVTTVAATRYTPKMTFTPASIASGYGLAAVGQF